MRYTVSFLWFILVKKLAREFRLHITGKSSRDELRDTNSRSGSGRRGVTVPFGPGYLSVPGPSLSPCPDWAEAPPLLHSQRPTLCSAHAAGSAVRLPEAAERRGRASGLHNSRAISLSSM